MVDSETRLDNTSVMPNNTFQYNYTLINVDKSMIDTIEFKKILEPTILNAIKTNPETAYQRDHNVTIKYCYKDKAGNYLCTILMSPDQYK